MPTFKTKYITLKKESKNLSVISNSEFEVFNENILGLGAIENKSKQMQSLSVMFDLEGFTNFCKQIDPQLAVPEYLSAFLKWMFEQIKSELVETKHEEGYETFADLPFLSKFMGDGVLFLWNTENMSETSILNVVVSMYEICNNYKTDFFPNILKSTTSPPPSLRCGIARGTVYSVGNGDDFVGPCINMSARLQKLHTLSFCFSRRGLNPKDMSDEYSEKFIVKRVDVRGIGPEELVCVTKNQFTKLQKPDKANFHDI